MPSGEAGHSKETASVNGEEGGDDVKSSWPLRLGLHTYYNGAYKGKRDREVEPISKNASQSGQESATRLLEVGIASNSGSACQGEWESLVILDQHARVNAFPGLVHTARHTTKVGFTRSR